MASKDDRWWFDGQPDVLALSTTHEDREVVLVLEGELDLANVGPLTDCVTHALETDGIRALVIDLASLAFIDSSSLQLLIDTQARAEAAGVQFRLRAPSPPVLRVLHLSGLDRLLPIEDSHPRQPPRPGEDQPGRH